MWPREVTVRCPQCDAEVPLRRAYIRTSRAEGRYVEVPCPRCEYPVRDYEAWYEARQCQGWRLVIMPEWFYWLGAAVALAYLFMWLLHKAGY